jgi:hypothetical protein
MSRFLGELSAGYFKRYFMLPGMTLVIPMHKILDLYLTLITTNVTSSSGS